MPLSIPYIQELWRRFLKVVPKAITKNIIGRVKEVALGQAIDLETSRQNIIQYFAKLGVSEQQLYDYLGIDSVTSYNWGCSANLDGEFTDVTAAYIKKIEEDDKKINIPFYPNISVGWDNNVRFNKFIPGVIKNNTPEAFKAACKKVKAFADESMGRGIMKAPFITVNSWNEWTETSYLEPDDLYGYGYLEAIKKVFCE